MAINFNSSGFRARLTFKSVNWNSKGFRSNFQLSKTSFRTNIDFISKVPKHKTHWISFVKSITIKPESFEQKSRIKEINIYGLLLEERDTYLSLFRSIMGYQTDGSAPDLAILFFDYDLSILDHFCLNLIKVFSKLKSSRAKWFS